MERPLPCESTWPINSAAQELRQAGWADRVEEGFRKTIENAPDFHPFVLIAWLESKNGMDADPETRLRIVRRVTENLLRGHAVTDHGEYGNSPLGSDFVLLNTDVERRLATIPLFNALNIPFISVKWEVFFVAAKTWDRNHVFKPSKLLLDTGAGLRFETPTHSFNIGYGRALREGQNVFFGYYERRLW